MHIAYEFIYSHITWFLEVLLVLFMGTAAISFYQLNNYNHTVAEVLSRYGGLTPQAADNLEREHNARYGNMFSVTTQDGKRTGPTVPYGDDIDYTIHPKIPFFNTYINAGVNEHVASEVRQAQAMYSRILTYNNINNLYYDSPASLFMNNLSAQDAVTLVGCTSNQQIIQSLTANVQKGDLSTLSKSAQDKLNHNQTTLSFEEFDTLQKALVSALQSKISFYAVFVIKHDDSTASKPDYDVIATTFVPQAMYSRTLTYNNQTPFYKEVEQQATSTSNNSKDQTTQNLIPAGLFIDNLDKQDAVALVGCTSIANPVGVAQKINIPSLTANVQKGDLSTLSESVRAKLDQNQITLAPAECDNLHKALASALQSKIPFYAIFVIKHADSTTGKPDYDVVATKFVPQTR